MVKEIILKDLDMKSAIIYKALSDQPLTLDLTRRIKRISYHDLDNSWINRTTYMRIIKGINYPRDRTLKVLAKLFGLSEEEIRFLISNSKTDVR